MIFKSNFKTGPFKTSLAGALAIGAAIASTLVARPAHATPRPLPFTYPYATLPEGAAEVELYGDMTPLRVQAADDPAAGRLWAPWYRLQAEFEYGITDHTELGFYWQMNAEPERTGGDNAMRFDGFKWRVRHRFAEPGELPVDIAVYLELETMHDELAVEEKLILEKRLGKLRWQANLWIEQALERPLDDAQRDFAFIINPTTGVTYEVTPTFHPGVEYWARGQLAPSGDGVDRINNTVHHFVGPTAHLNFGKLWWTAGLYANLNNVNKPQPDEIYGPVWFRTVLGIDL